MTTLWSRDHEIQEIARKVPDPLSMKAGSGNETMHYFHASGTVRKLLWYHRITYVFPLTLSNFIFVCRQRGGETIATVEEGGAGSATPTHAHYRAA